jgi:hypothetical protein
MNIKEVSGKIWFNYWPQIVLIFVILAGYGQIVFFQTTFKFDAIYNHLPWHHIIVDNLRHGHLPLWNYYQHLGTPIHANPPRGAWYPLLWIFSLFGTYDLYAYHIEFMIHIILAGLGIQYLSGILKFSKITSLFVSVSYVLSGFFVASGDFFTWIVTAAWVPFIAGSYIKLIYKPSFKTTAVFSFFVFMLLLQGYPSLYIVLIYYMLLATIALLTNSFVNNRELFKKQLLWLSAFLVIILTLSAVLPASYYYLLPNSSRFHSYSIEQASYVPFKYGFLGSLLLPWRYITYDFFKTFPLDSANIYMGIITLTFLIYSLLSFRKWDLKLKIFALTLIPFLMFSTGSSSFLFRFAYDYLPGIKLLSFPTMHRYYFSFGLIIISGFGIEYFIKDYNLKKIRNALFITFFALSVFFVYSVFRVKPSDFYTSGTLYDFVKNLTGDAEAVIQSVFLMMILAAAFAVTYSNNKKHIITMLFIISTADLIAAFNLQAPIAMTSYKSNVKESNEIIHKSVKPFDFEDNKNIYKNTIQHDSLYLFSFSINIYQKKITALRHNSFLPAGFSFLYDTDKAFLDSVLKNPFVYIRNTEGKKLPDSLIVSKKFDYNTIKLTTNTERKTEVVMLQNIYPGWKAFVDDKEAKLDTADRIFMKTTIPAGMHKVEFRFEPKAVITGFYISAISFTGLVFYLIFSVLYGNNKINRFFAHKENNA